MPKSLAIFMGAAAFVLSIVIIIVIAIAPILMLDTEENAKDIGTKIAKVKNKKQEKLLNEREKFEKNYKTLNEELTFNRMQRSPKLYKLIQLKLTEKYRKFSKDPKLAKAEKEQSEKNKAEIIKLTIEIAALDYKISSIRKSIYNELETYIGASLDYKVIMAIKSIMLTRESNNKKENGEEERDDEISEEFINEIYDVFLGQCDFVDYRVDTKITPLSFIVDKTPVTVNKECKEKITIYKINIYGKDIEGIIKHFKLTKEETEQFYEMMDISAKEEVKPLVAEKTIQMDSIFGEIQGLIAKQYYYRHGGKVTDKIEDFKPKIPQVITAMSVDGESLYTADELAEFGECKKIDETEKNMVVVTKTGHYSTGRKQDIKGIDSLGLAAFVFDKAKYPIPNTLMEVYNKSYPITKAQVKQGDFAFTCDPSRTVPDVGETTFGLYSGMKDSNGNLMYYYCDPKPPKNEYPAPNLEQKNTKQTGSLLLGKYADFIYFRRLFNFNKKELGIDEEHKGGDGEDDEDDGGTVITNN